MMSTVLVVMWIKICIASPFGGWGQGRGLDMQGGDLLRIILTLILYSICLGLPRVDSTIGKLGTFAAGFKINITK